MMSWISSLDRNPEEEFIELYEVGPQSEVPEDNYMTQLYRVLK